jgi:exonuclease III
MYTNECAPDIICLQELWQFPSVVDFNLNGYHPLIYTLRHNNVQGGGVGIFIKNCFKYTHLPGLSLFVDRVLESIFVEVQVNNNSKLTIGSIYRPGSAHPTLSYNEQFSHFFDLLSNLSSELLDN